MADERPQPSGKTRTREHIIGDLAVNHLERQVLRAGYTAERFRYDYGLDVAIFPYDAHGEPEKGFVFVQVKGTEECTTLRSGDVIPLRVSRNHLPAWLNEPLPIILMLYDAAADLAYWVYVQRYFESLPEFDLFAAGQTVTIHLPTAQVLNREAILLFGEYLRQIQRQLEGTVRHV